MTRDEAYVMLNKVFQDIFDDETITVNDETTADDVEDWDSLTHITVVVAVEKRFGVKFNIGEVNSFKNVGEMMDTLMKRIS